MSHCHQGCHAHALNLLDSFKETGVRGEVTVMSRAAGSQKKPLGKMGTLRQMKCPDPATICQQFGIPVSVDADLARSREQLRAKHWHGGPKLIIAEPYFLERTSKVFQRDVHPTSGTGITG
eukprot:Em0011g598a